MGGINLGMRFPGRPGRHCVIATRGRRDRHPRRTLAGMVDRTYLVKLKPPNQPVQHVVAATVEVHGEHLASLNGDGKLTALFLAETVQSWNVLLGFIGKCSGRSSS